MSFSLGATPNGEQPPEQHALRWRAGDIVPRWSTTTGAMVAAASADTAFAELVFAFAALCLTACGTDPVRPPALGACEGAQCRPTSIVLGGDVASGGTSDAGGGTSDAGGGTGGAGGTGNTAGTNGSAATGTGGLGVASAGGTGDAGVSVAVDVNVTIDQDFRATQPYGGAVRVGARATDGGEVFASGVASVASPLVLAGVVPGQNWFAVTDDPNGAGNLLPTLTPVSVDRANQGIHLVAMAADWGSVYLSFGLPSLDTSAAQAMITFEQAGAPVAGVQIADDLPEAGASAITVAYDDGAGGYEPADTANATGPLGTALLLNWPAGPYYPGSTTTVAFTLPGQPASPLATDIVMASGYITRAVVFLQ